MNEVADVLDKAHDELLVRGWTQKDYTRRGAVCALGALRCAVHGTPHRSLLGHDLGVAAADALAAFLGIPECDIDEWNDDEASSIDDVLDAFRGAAKELREVSP